MAQPFWQDENASSYARLVTSLNGRFRGFSCRAKMASDLHNDFDLSRNSAAKTLIILAVLIILFSVWMRSGDFAEAISVLKSTQWGRIYIVVGLTLMAINIAAFFWRLFLILRYRAIKSCTDQQLPSCTVIVPAYNEGRQVLRTLRSIARSDYPIDKLQIIAIDDGSRDNTWYWIEKAARELSGKIEAIRLPRNGGKRQALYEGFRRGSGQIMVTIDSDCLVEPQSIRRLVSPFYFDKRIGAVAGNIRILNRHQGIIPRMLEVSFAFGCEFMRASQSMVGSVFCTPGALAAYRRERLMPVLDNWLSQTFFGGSANIAEDHALTNWILRTDSLVTYQCDAIVYTNVPTDYSGLCRMFLRWARGYFRESLAMATFIFGKFRSGPALGARVNFVLSCVNLLIPQFLLFGVLLCVLWRPEIFVMQLLFGSVLSACVPAAFYALRRNASNALWAFAHNIFWVTTLFWIPLYSMLTCHKDGWLTRQINTSGIGIDQPRLTVSRSAA